MRMKSSTRRSALCRPQPDQYNWLAKGRSHQGGQRRQGNEVTDLTFFQRELGQFRELVEAVNNLTWKEC